MAAMLTGLALMAFSYESDAQTSRTVKKKETTTVTKPAPEKSKTVTRSAPVTRKATPQTQQKPSSKPDQDQQRKPATKPGKPQPQKPVARPGRHDGPSRPATRPDHYRPGRPAIVPARPPRPNPRPIVAPKLIYRPPLGAVVAISISSDRLRLSKVRLRDDVDYFYEDGYFYAITSYGTYYEIDPPAGALVDRLPANLRRFTIDGRELYRYDDTVYRLVVVEGIPYFEVLGQVY